MAYTEDVNIRMNLLSGAMGGATAIISGMSAMTSTFGEFGTMASDTFGELSGLLVSASSLIAVFGIQAAEAFGQFEQGMKIVQTVSGQTGASIQELSNKANEMSISYRTAIGDITDGLQTLGRAGLNSATTQLEVLESGLQTAKLEGRNLNGVLEELIQNTAMLGGDLKSIDFGAQSEYLNTIMVGTSMTAPITSHDISQTLQYAGGTAAAAGANLESTEGKKKLEDLMGTIAAFAQKGVTGSMAGTALRAFFTKPASQDESVVNALGTLGLSPGDLWEDGGNSMKSVSDQIGIIQRKMDALNMSTMDQVELWGKIVGPKMGQQMMKLDSSSIKELTRDIQSAQSAESLATQTLQTYTQKVSELQQQGDLAFRNIGEKIVMWITPAVEIITKLLGMFSTREGSFVAFLTLGAVFGRGIRVAYSMVTAFFAKFQALIGETIGAIQTLNGTAGGSASGFANSAAQVEFLNAKLAQTNTELAMMQSQFMKFNVSKAGTGVMPLGIVGPGGKIPANMIDHAPQKVLRMGGVRGEGRFYDQSDEASFRKAYQAKLQEEADTKAKNAVKEKSFVDSRGKTFYRDANNEIVNKSQAYKSFQKQFALSDEEVTKRTDAAVKSGAGQVHSTLRSMTMKEYNAWMGDLQKADAQLKQKWRYTKGLSDGYVDDKGNYTDKYHQDQLKSENLRRQQEFERNAAKEGGIHTSTVNGQKMMRANVMHLPQERMFEVERVLQKEAQLKQFEKARANVINQQQARALGAGAGLSNKAQQAASSRLSSLSQAAQGARQSLTAFKTKMLSTAGNLDLTGKRTQQILGQAMTTLSAEIKEGGMTFEEALIRLSEMTGLSAEELAVALTKTEGGLNAFGMKLAELGLVTTEGEVATIANTEAIIANTAAEVTNTGSHLWSSFKSGMSGVVNLLGGSVMAGMMGITFAIQQIQANMQAWQERMSDAVNQLSEASDKLNKAEEQFQDTYSKENANMSDADLDRITDAQYGAIQEAYNNNINPSYADMTVKSVSSIGTPQLSDEEKKRVEKTGKQITPGIEAMQKLEESAKDITVEKEENISELQKNTAALNAATYAYAQSESLKLREFTDGTWGFNGFGSQYSDGTTVSPDPMSLINIIKNRANLQDNGFLDTNSPILTASMASKDYQGSTELAGAFSKYSYESDNSFKHWLFSGLGIDSQDKEFERTLQATLGNDYDRIYGLMKNMDGKLDGDAIGALKSYHQTFSEMDEKTVGMAQLLFKDNKEDLQKLGKQMFRYEQQYGFDPNHSAIGDYQLLKQEIHPNQRQALMGSPGTGNLKKQDITKMAKNFGKTKLTVTDRNLINTVNKLIKLSDGKLTEANVLAMGQMQQLQDMHQIASEEISPGVMQTVQGVLDNVTATGTAASNAGNASNNAGTAANNAAAIADVLGAKAIETAENDERLSLIRRGLISGEMTEDEFRSKLAKGELPLAEREIETALEGSSWSFHTGDFDKDHQKTNAQRLYQELSKQEGGYDAKTKTAVWGIAQYVEGAVTAAYNSSNIGEYGQGNTGGGSGSGGGDGSGSGSDKDNSGNKISRVDLVLCNKKTIPKLNVNLFKKPPQFTINNKQFSLRDININTQDKPDAMVDAIKNGIIKTQQQMDPKIIQDEQAVYDPAAATDGTTPTGNTPVSTK